MNRKKIVLITTGQPACNPRIVKEADALAAAGHEVSMLYCYFINWADEKDKSLLQKVSWKYKKVGGSPYERPQMQITIDRTLAVGKYEVTQQEWDALMGSNPGQFTDCGLRCPAERISWHDTKQYLRKLHK